MSDVVKNFNIAVTTSLNIHTIILIRF